MQRVGLVERIRLRRIARLESDDRPVFKRQFDGWDRRRTGRILRILRSTRTCESGACKSRPGEPCAGEARFGLARAAKRIRTQQVSATDTRPDRASSSRATRGA
jgi:hypothetical protein